MATRPTVLDATDRLLLQALQEDARATSEALGDRVHLSPTSVQRRIKRLRAAGVIQADVVVLDPKALGRPISMFVHVILERERADVIDRFKEAIRTTPEVMMGYHVTGETDFVLLVTATSMEGFEQFTRSFLYGLPEIKTFKTMVVMDRVKAGFSLPIPLDDADGGDA